MGIRVAVQHQTRYHYDRLIRLGPQTVRLRPAPHSRTPVTSYSLTVSPKQHFINWQQDPHGNHLARLVFPEPTRSLELSVDLVAELTSINPFDFFLEPDAERFPFEYSDDLRRELGPFFEIEPQGARFARYVKSLDVMPRATMDFLVDLNVKIQQDIEYTLRLEPGLQTPEETLQVGRGSCRDFAYLSMQLLRHLGIASRFVSGYSVQLRPDVKPLEGPAGVLEDVVDLHAWVEAYLPGAGWVGMDGTSGLMAGEGHIPLACTPRPSSAAPISGTLDDCETEFQFAMSVTRLREDPRNTRPYTEETWQEILSCGAQVDERLRGGDVRLTMGGEPTFVSIDDFVGEEWNTAALGQSKRQRAEDLLRRLRDRFGEGGLLHYAQGKWYPGESLPRWALQCLWRADGEPIWKDERLLADPLTPGTATVEDGEAFARALATRLGVEPEHVVPAHEDVAYYLWREGRLPVNVTPEDTRLADAEERARMARVFERGLGAAVGHVLPLRHDETTWVSGPWDVRTKHLFLTPGDSPIGLRLPLESLPFDPHAKDEEMHVTDPTLPRAPLPARPTHVGQGMHASQPISSPSSRNRAPGRPVRTALCVEVREGIPCVFLPPLPTLPIFLELIAAIEETAAEREQPVLIEGYAPETDSRLRCIKVTPDPGVIEINIHPAADWDELAATTLGLYEDARQARLGPEKYLVDGRVVGTGGGNHIVMGARTPLDSPFLRRPDLLRSLLACWNNHPSLSYLFASLFIGPTSQAPRVDEGRPEALHELEIAFRQCEGTASIPPWLVDRVFRHLLVDVTGNTHRTEFCIDKLYSPDSASGRLGLVEVRSFEMPPHPHMSLAQQLLLRALIARFWDSPHPGRLVRWGTTLQDRFMLPHFVRSDFEDVLAELRETGFAFQWDWFAPHFEFRFPRIGTIVHAGVELELRTALEPWHVLGEEPGGGGTVRFVDSSVERIQVLVRGATQGRHAVLCNGRLLPLHATGRQGEFVAGVRFRAWQPPHGLHPTIAVHAPLTFDLHDRWAGRALGGCRYHVGHPGGRNYETPPVNPLEAEGRRKARFEPIGHSQGSRDILEPVASLDLPLTLDLRRS